MSRQLDHHTVFESQGTSQTIHLRAHMGKYSRRGSVAVLPSATGFHKEAILRFPKSLIELKIPNNSKSTKIFVKIQLHLFIC